MKFLYALAEPLAFIIRPIYEWIGDYGLTLIVVTLLIKIITIPFSIMSQKSTARTQLIQPELQKIQEKYKNDKNMQSIKMQELYKKNNVNPMGGCLPLILQMFILFGFIRVVYDPLTYMLGLTKEQIDTITTALGVEGAVYQVSLCGIEGFAAELAKLGKDMIDFDFFGIDLTMIPKDHWTSITAWIFPALAVIATYISSYVTKKQMENNKKTDKKRTNEAADQAQSMSNSMMTFMPIMTAFFTVTMPVGMSLYWFISTAFQLLQQAFMTKVINKKIEEEIMAERKVK